ncbi:hypothetical protein DMENIID0001_042960 [Sergentomyia squamirostris]
MIVTNITNNTTSFHMLSPKDSPVERIAGRLILALGSSAVLLIWIMYKVFRVQYWNFVKKVKDLDSKMISLNYPLDLNGEFRSFVIYLAILLTIFHITVITTTSVMVIDSFWLNFLWFYDIYITNGPLMTSNHTGILFIRATRIRFAAMNKFIKTVLQTSEDDPKNLPHEEKTIRILIDISQCHSDLIDRVEDINHFFGFQMLMTFSTLFFYGIFSFFAIYRAVIGTSPWSCYNVNNVMWNGFHFGTTTYFIKEASALRSESDETGVLIHKVANFLQKPTSELLERLGLLSQQLQHRSSVVSCGFFDFDWILWYTLVGSTVSMVILFIQFDSAAVAQLNINITMSGN